jgi:hypothetical protein
MSQDGGVIAQRARENEKYDKDGPEKRRLIDAELAQLKEWSWNPAWLEIREGALLSKPLKAVREDLNPLVRQLLGIN